MFLSTFDLFKIGIGPSSSHTIGPMLAAARFVDEIARRDWPGSGDAHIARLSCTLHGSLAYTGIGHATDRAVILGLAGHKPDTIDPDLMQPIIDEVTRTRMIAPPGHAPFAFDPAADLIFDRKNPLAGHANGMTFQAFDADDRLLLRRAYFSIGGGFVVTEEELNLRVVSGSKVDVDPVPFPFSSGDEMIAMADQSGLTIADMKRANERARDPSGDLDGRLDAVWAAMDSSIERGLKSEGVLPGGLKVRRRAAAMARQLEEEAQSNRCDPLGANRWLTVWAMAVNEENAAGGRVVTAPTNGAAGTLPAVLKYVTRFHDAGSMRENVRLFLLTAAAVGGLIKHNASISGAEVGCQGEVGSAAAMAAAGLAAVMGGTPRQIENAAEIALEHHLGMTCDPVAGLVQVPCIERNGLAAVKAVTAASLALAGDGEHIVSLDACVETMRQTGLDMNEKYKETSLGGLAVNVSAC